MDYNTKLTVAALGLCLTGAGAYAWQGPALPQPSIAIHYGIPIIFFISALVVFIGTERSDKFALWAIPTFGYGWLALVVWFGMLHH